MSFVKTPQRTLRWARVCAFVDREALSTFRNRIPAEERELYEFCREERDKALAEGYDDAAQYLQHIIDDLKII